MKKITALVLATVMVMGMSAAAFSDTPTPDTKTTTVTYTKEQSYTWTVPESLTAGGAAGTVEASAVYIPHGTELKISITGGVETDDYITLTDKDHSGNTIKAKVTYSTLTVKAGTVNGGSEPVSVAAPESVPITGTYTGTITFTAEVVTATNS